MAWAAKTALSDETRESRRKRYAFGNRPAAPMRKLATKSGTRWSTGESRKGALSTHPSNKLGLSITARSVVSPPMEWPRANMGSLPHPVTCDSMEAGHVMVSAGDCARDGRWTLSSGKCLIGVDVRGPRGKPHRRHRLPHL